MSSFLPSSFSIVGENPRKGLTPRVGLAASTVCEAERGNATLVKFGRFLWSGGDIF